MAFNELEQAQLIEALSRLNGDQMLQWASDVRSTFCLRQERVHAVSLTLDLPGKVHQRR